MGAAIQKMFWGFIIVIVDFTISQFDIFVDLIGYIFVLNGLRQLQSKNQSFVAASKFTMVLAVLSIFNLVPVETNVATLVPSTTFINNLIFSAIDSLIHLALVGHILQGLIKVAEEHHKHLALTLESRLKLYVITAFALLAITPFILNVPEETGRIMITIIAIMGTFIELIFLYMLWKFKSIV
ncbi:MAG TPA: hypothetical protein VNM69_00825 [Bacillus sp. (in: firmicutes)]|nr:hypothetical protein [Bacillus sp. (in: firmicutes)]